jgi:glycosyltransferase involved in cell wall biosynthesis
MTKKVAVWSNCSLAKTGFAKHARILLRWLQDNGYEPVEFACGVAENAPVLETLPWKAYGLTPNNPEQIKHLQDIGGGPMIGYGRILIEQVILKEKPDVIIAIEDSWAWNGFLERPIYQKLKDNWIFWSPVDSKPLMAEQLAFFKEVKHSAVKASFAQKELAKNRIKTEFWPALTDTQSIKPDKAAGMALRKNSGISEDTLLFGFVFRNQLRKLVIPQFQALKMFKDKYPDKKAKLVFHTNPFEPDQWNCVRHTELEGLTPDDVYYTTICPACRNIFLGPAMTEKTMCKCGRGELHHAKAEHGVTEEELNSIYNSFDAYTHTAGSGGFELPEIEALLAGIPTACPNYSYGEMFVESGFVHSLPFTVYNEVRSGYIKAHTTPKGILEFWEKVKDFTSEEKVNLLNAQRDWSLTFTDTNKICSQVGVLVDSLPPPDYTWSFPCFEPAISLAEKDEDFVKEMSFEVFGEFIPNIAAESVDALQKGATRDWITQRFVEIAQQSQQKIDYKKLFKDDGKKRLLICLEKSLGDVLIFSSVLEKLKEKYADWSIYFMTNSANRDLVSHIQGINIIWTDGFPAGLVDNTHFWEGSGNYEKLVDVYLQPFQLTQRFSGWQHNGNKI